MKNQNSPLQYVIPFALLAMLSLFIINEFMTAQDPSLSAGNTHIPLPVFSLPNLWDPTRLVTQNDFNNGHVSLLHVWGAWCSACRHEHAMMMEINKTYHVSIYSIDYKDDPAAAKLWLINEGNPYSTTLMDLTGKVSRALGVYGTPETFIIDKHGIIRYRHIGTIDKATWNEILFPIINQYIKAD
jgi:cytochrome c biogenesis protein CcmG/thiol:disulfide interchange protein DsbE